MINLNIGTLVIHLVWFMFIIFLLNHLLFKPMLAVMDKRTEKIDGNAKAAKEARDKVDAIISDFEIKLAEARREANQEREVLRKAAAEEEDKIIKSAREYAGNMVAEIREKISAEYDAAQTALRSDSEAMGKEIAGKILGREV